ncbi:hypothetical protein [Actinoplanes sp. NPDC051859]|uniref:hypothetical protein n=1 Tax=Actinoplanes sp. NPDC051859 TaxID=3363909 RepID=UPI0037B8DEBD
MRTALKIGTALLITAAGTAGWGQPALAHDHPGTGSSAGHANHKIVAAAQLRQLNRSHAYGVATARVNGKKVTVSVVVKGLLRSAPHAMHIHAGTKGKCPTAKADTNHDGFVSVTEGHPFYGHIAASLTTRGDTSPASGLAIDRFPAPKSGTVVYKRTIKVDAHTAMAIKHRNAVIVVHGVDRNGSGVYDGSVKSDLDPKLPMEATAPAACGTLRPLH